MKQKQLDFNIDNLGCASCAAKMEKAIGELPEIDEALLDFAASKLYLRINTESDTTQLLPMLDRIVKSIEEDARLISKNQEDTLQNADTDTVTSQKRASLQRQISWYRAFPVKKAARFLLGLIPFIFAFVARSDNEMLSIMLFLTAWIILGFDVIYKALRKLFSGRLFDENFLMTVATVGALIIGEYPEAVAVMLFYQIGEMFQDMAVNHSRASIKALSRLRPDHANRLIGSNSNNYEVINPEDAIVGDVLLVKPGERVPLDGVIVKGKSELDKSVLTGESLPVPVGISDEVMAGSINGSGLLEFRVEKPYEQSAIARIMDMVEQASARKSKAEQFITRFAAWYTPIMTGLALALAVIPPLITGQPFSDWIYRAMILLVISCPCALVLSVPMSYFAGLGAASSRGLLVKGGQYLDRLAQVKQIVFDKTGTLTMGEFEVAEISAAAGYSSEQILTMAAILEGPSNHPIASSIRKAAEENDAASENYNYIISDYQDRPGLGVQASIDGKSYRLGNSRMLQESGVAVPAELSPGENYGQYIWLLQDNNFIGRIKLTDRIKPEAAETLIMLRSSGIEKMVMLTGDRPESAVGVFNELVLDEFHAGLLPDQKVEYLEKLMSYDLEKNRKITMFVGDGINDAPVLARADLGVAIGSATDAAVESADIVIMGNDLGKLTEGIRLAKRTSAIVRQNVSLTLGLKLVIMTLALFGLSGIWQAVFADVGVSLLAVLNALRLLRKDKSTKLRRIDKKQTAGI